MLHFSRIVKALSLLMLPMTALAHSGHAESSSFMQGVLHPATGIDHLLAMIAVGIWGAQQGGRMRWIAPLSFVAMMLAGTLLAAAGVALPNVETGIALSVVVLGVAIALALRAHVVVGATIAGTFAVFHGYAHGVEANNVGGAYILGMLFATISLHAIGIAAATAIQHRSRQALRWTGASIAAGGVALIGM